MPLAIILALSVISGGTVLTYLYCREAIFWLRLAIGICTGFAAAGVIGFVAAYWLGMNQLTLFVITAIAASPLLVFRNQTWRVRVRSDIEESFNYVRDAVLRPSWVRTGTLVFYCAVAFVLWLVCDRAMFQSGQGMFTGLDTNLGDLPFHLAVITGFAFGENFPPQHPEFAGVPMTYPFIVDFVTAMFVRGGAELRTAFVWQNFAMMLSLVGLLHHWAWKFTRDRVAPFLTVLLVFMSGGFGWWQFLKESAQGKGASAHLDVMPHDYTIGLTGFRWGNALTSLFVPQRGILLGLGLALVVWTLWPVSKDDIEDDLDTNKTLFKFPVRLSSLKKFILLQVNRPMIGAGLITGLLPLIHAHSFVVTMSMAGCVSLLQCYLSFRKAQAETETQTGARGRIPHIAMQWLPFFACATILGLPQMLFATSGSAVRAAQFLAWEPGWDHGTDNVIWFWLKNTGVFIPLIVAALVWHAYERFIPTRLLVFSIPFLLCFIVPNMFRLSPWIWDNIKILLFWWVALSPVIALLLVKMWRQKHGWRTFAMALLIMQVAAGGLDIWRAASAKVERQTYATQGLRFAELIQRSTSPNALILHAPTYNDPVYLSGRRSFMGYPGHLWSHGLEYSDRQAELKSIYSGSPEASSLIAKNRIDYIVVGPLEEAELKNLGVRLSRSFFDRYQKIGEEGEYRLYKTAQP